VQADVGIAIGAGTDVAIESADIVLVKNDPRDVVGIVELSKKTYAKMAQNLLWATGYNAFAIPLAAGVLYGFGILLSPAVGAILMSASTVVVAINARLLRMPQTLRRPVTALSGRTTSPGSRTPRPHVSGRP
jgi:Cu2+-exporting ATPase